MDKNSIRVKIKFVALNSFTDCTDSFISAVFPLSPKVQGLEVAGTIEKVGPIVQEQFGDKFQEKTEVIGLLPPDYATKQDIIEAPFFYFLPKPSNLALENCLAILSPGIRAFSTLYYKGRVRSGDSILILNPTLIENSITIQLALLWNCKVYLHTINEEEETYLQKTYSSNSESSKTAENLFFLRVPQNSEKSLYISSLEVTQEIGFDFLLDFFSQNVFFSFPTIHLIKSLAVHGTLITTNFKLQIDPPESSLLFFKNANICYNFDQVYNFSSSSLGQYQHISEKIFEMFQKNEITNPNFIVEKEWNIALDKIQKLNRERILIQRN